MSEPKPRYEYKIIALTLMSESHLNLLALSRWRLIAVTADTDGSKTFYFEREYIAEKSTEEKP